MTEMTFPFPDFTYSDLRKNKVTCLRSLRSLRAELPYTFLGQTLPTIILSVALSAGIPGSNVTAVITQAP